jgi:hypothetical protein
VPERIAIVEESNITGNENVRPVVGQAVSYSCTRAAIYTARAAVGIYLYIFLFGKQPDNIAIAYTHAVGKVQVTIVRKVLQNGAYQFKLGKFILRKELFECTYGSALFYFP